MQGLTGGKQSAESVKLVHQDETRTILEKIKLHYHLNVLMKQFSNEATMSLTHFSQEKTILTRTKKYTLPQGSGPCSYGQYDFIFANQ